MSGILSGIRVLDFGRYIAGPLCGALLADMGADVIRIEKPGGADDRYIMPATDGGEGALYLQSNRGKRSLTLDTVDPRGRRVVERLIGQSDVVIANVSPRALLHLGLDYATLSGIRPDIVLTTVTAFGGKGPMREAPGFDGVGQAVSGAVSLTGEAGRPFRSATAYVDYSTALAAALGTVAALFDRARTGRGRHVESSLVGNALNIMAPILIEHASGRHDRVPTGNRSPIGGPSDIFAAKDGWFIMQVLGNKMFGRWAALVGKSELADDPRFASDPARGRHGAELSAIMSDWAGGRTVEEALAGLASAGLSGSPVLTPDDILGGALGLQDSYSDAVSYPGASDLRIYRSPVQLSGEAQSVVGRPPTLGEHTSQILTELGLSVAEVDTLVCDGLV